MSARDHSTDQVEPPRPVLEQLLTIEQVAQALQVSSKTVRRLVAYRRLPCVRFGRSLRFASGDVLRWLAARREG